MVQAALRRAVQEFHDSYIESANGLIRSTFVNPSPQFRLQPVPWPLSSTSEASNLSEISLRTGNLTLEHEEEPKHFTEESEEREQIRTRQGNSNIYHINTRKLDDIDADDALVGTFQHLREHFRAFRSLPRPVYRFVGEKMKPEDHSGLITGLLDNVFIVINGNSAYTWWESMPCDRAWVWAVDPEFEDDRRAGKHGNGLHEHYRGYVRVRLQQLANWFYEARRFQPEVTLRDLWNAARQSSQYSFVSLNPDLYHVKSINSNTGSALRPAHLREVRTKTVTGGTLSRWVV
ncbi:hypothetical protein AMS68_000115 [Peltaster fructicola]|uniref:Uncharacterized protein n=1 Tax=Peltaster fructicola TaxID=286661 RepID=A0A6H0XIX3_9PEZI|nr:hypothetical protein AMS68_000115 [Peltaster fructicola]